MINYRNLAIQGALAFSFLMQPAFAQQLVQDDLITGSNQTTPWQLCGTDSLAIDVSTLDAGGCAYRTTPAEAGTTYTMSCGVVVVKFASITLAYLDAADNTLATESTEVVEHVTGAYSVTLEAPAGTTTAAIGIYGEPGSGFQDCVLIDATPPPEPTKGSIAGVTWFDESADSVLDPAESLISGTPVSLFEGTELLAQTQTTSDGEYYFGNLDVDVCYTVNFSPADGTLELAAPGADNDALASGQTNEICLTEAAPDTTDIDAGFVAIPPVIPPADNVICGVAWVDMNSNGIFDGTDTTLANVRARLFEGSTRIGSVRTDENGNYAFFKLADGDYSVRFATPDGHEPTTLSGQPLAGSSYIDADGRTVVFNLPAASNTSADSACTIQNVNAGYTQLPIVLAPTVAKDDAVVFDTGVNFGIDFLANDMPCDAAVHEVNLLGHNVPGNVTYNAQSQQFEVSDTTAFGVYSIEYGLRGACGSYDTASVRVELLEVIPPAPPTAPDAPICQIETGGSQTLGGVDVFNGSENVFASNYNFYDRDRKLVTTVDSSDPSHRLFIAHNYNTPAMDPYVGSWEIEWTGSHYGFNQLSIYYVAAVENGEVSELTECVRSQISPIAIDLSNKGRIQRLVGNYSVDVDGDGIKEALGQWFAPSAGILVTADASGPIDGNHMFGNVPGVYADGFEELATLDENRDGELAGAELSTLAIWIDRNSDTIVDEGELSSLADNQIVALAVNHYKYMARATKANGKTVLMEDVWLPLAPLAAR